MPAVSAGNPRTGAQATQSALEDVSPDEVDGSSASLDSENARVPGRPLHLTPRRHPYPLPGAQPGGISERRTPAARCWLVSGPAIGRRYHALAHGVARRHDAIRHRIALA